MTLTPAFLDELRARTSLSALVGKTVKLTKAGREHKGCCPFHNEKTPSFYVNDDKGFYHCFGCSAHGDAIRWMTDQRGLPFIDAVKELAQAAGMEMPAMDRRAAQQAERAKGLHDAMTEAQAWFAAQMQGIAGAEARAFAEKRGLTAATIRDFGIGFAPDARNRLKPALPDYTAGQLIEAGLLISVEGKEPYDRFRGRLMIPIRDVRGRTIAFGGRVIGDGEPKYLNSPDTPLFDKGRTLYNLDRAAPAARKADRLFVVEGYMDVIALAQAGVAEVVAPLGTALTEHQLERLWRMVDVPILCLDGDGAGQKAAIRAAHRALPMLAPGKSLSFVTLPEGQDPDDVVRKGGVAAFEALAREPEPLVDRLWKHAVVSFDTSSPDGRAALQKSLFDLADGIRDRLVSVEYKRSFKDFFWGTFGWKPRDVAGVRKAMEGLRDRTTIDPETRLWRAVLLGISRYPRVLHGELERLSGARVKNEYLSRWRDILVEAALARPELDVNLVETILAQSDVSPIEKADLTRDLPFTFVCSGATAEVAERDLRDVIQTLDREQRLGDEIRESHERFLSSLSEADWRLHRSLILARHNLEEQHRTYLELAQEAA